jgi:hypothetical protein
MTNSYNPVPNPATTPYGGANPNVAQQSSLGGQYQAGVAPINAAAYNNPVGNQAPAWQTAMNSYLANTTGAAPQAGIVSQGAVNTNLQQQQQLALLYQQQAAGNGPSLAQVTAQQQGGNAYANSLGLLAAGGGNPALAGLNARNAGAAATNQVAQTAVQGRTAEEMNALGALGNTYGTIGQEGATQAGQVAQQGQFNVGAQQQQTSLNQAAYNNYIANLQAQNAQQFQAQQNEQQLTSNNYNAAQGIAAQAYQAQQANQWGAIDAGISAVGAVGGMAAKSDQNAKTDIKDGSSDVKDFLSHLKVHRYQYKDKSDGEGTHFSVMAQELEKAGKVGKSMVIDTPKGKMVDYSRGFAVYLAAATDLNKRVSELEGLSSLGGK